MINYIKNKLKSPICIFIIALIVMFFAFTAPAVVDFIFGGAFLITAKFLFSVALMLLGVLICRKARAAFIDGDANGSTKTLVPVIYACCAVLAAISVFSG